MSANIEKRVEKLEQKRAELENEMREIDRKISKLQEKNYKKNLNELARHWNYPVNFQTIFDSITAYREEFHGGDNGWSKIFNWHFTYDCTKDKTLKKSCLFCKHNKKHGKEQTTEHKIDLHLERHESEFYWGYVDEDYLCDITLDDFNDQTVLNHSKHGPIHILQYMIVKDDSY